MFTLKTESDGFDKVVAVYEDGEYLGIDLYPQTVTFSLEGSELILRPVLSTPKSYEEMVRNLRGDLLLQIIQRREY